MTGGAQDPVKCRSCRGERVKPGPRYCKMCNGEGLRPAELVAALRRLLMLSSSASRPSAIDSSR